MQDYSSDPRFKDIIHTGYVQDIEALHVTIVGVPQHIGVERNGGRVGAAQAPSQIRIALNKLATSGCIEAITAKKLVIADVGDIDCEGKTLEQIADTQYDVVSELLQLGHVPIVLGGGHDVAWPTLRAMEGTGKSFGVINIDAHADVRPLLDDTKAHSGSAFRQLLDQTNSQLLPAGFVEFGLQHHAVAHQHLLYLQSKGMHAMMLPDIRRKGTQFMWQEAWQKAASAHSVYVSLDMDAFSSAFSPGVSAPAADGFMPHEIAGCLYQAACSGSLTVFDVVEYNPEYDVDNRTAKLAATMIAEVIAGLAWKCLEH